MDFLCAINLERVNMLNIGDEVILRLKDEELFITIAEHALLKLREKVKQHNKKNISLVNDLLNTRRIEM
jgi:hypothetical protein